MRRLLFATKNFDAEALLSLQQLYDVRSCTVTELLQELLAFRPELMVVELSDSDAAFSGTLRLARSMGVCPRTLALSYSSSDMMMQLLAEGIITFLLVSPFEHRDLLQRLQEMELLLTKNRSERIEELTVSVLQELGIGASTSGFRYLLEAVLYLFDHESCLLTDELYPYVAKRCKATATSVEKATSRAIEQGWCHGNALVWQHYFGLLTRFPSNSKFFKGIIQAVKEQL